MISMRVNHRRCRELQIADLVAPDRETRSELKADGPLALCSPSPPRRRSPLPPPPPPPPPRPRSRARATAASIRSSALSIATGQHKKKSNALEKPTTPRLNRLLNLLLRQFDEVPSRDHARAVRVRLPGAGHGCSARAGGTRASIYYGYAGACLRPESVTLTWRLCCPFRLTLGARNLSIISKRY
eukprot:489746-Hanusia_phi.AAC.4